MPNLKTHGTIQVGIHNPGRLPLPLINIEPQSIPKYIATEVTIDLKQAYTDLYKSFVLVEAERRLIKSEAAVFQPAVSNILVHAIPGFRRMRNCRGDFGNDGYTEDGKYYQLSARECYELAEERTKFDTDFKKIISKEGHGSILTPTGYFPIINDKGRGDMDEYIKECNYLRMKYKLQSCQVMLIDDLMRLFAKLPLNTQCTIMGIPPLPFGFV